MAQQDTRGQEEDAGKEKHGGDDYLERVYGQITLHHGGRFSSYDVLWCASGQEWKDPASQRMPRQGIANCVQLPSEACS